MTITTIAAPPCPTWCAEHRDDGDAGLIHTSAVRTVEDFSDREGFVGSPATTLGIRVEQFEGFDPATRQVYREGAEIVGDDERRPDGIHFVIGSAGDAQRLGEALAAVAQVLSAVEGQDEESWSDVQLTGSAADR